MDKYVPQLKSTDLVSPEGLKVGKSRHIYILDLIDAIRSFDDEEMLVFLYGGRTQIEIADMLGVNQSSVSRRLKRLITRAS